MTGNRITPMTGPALLGEEMPMCIWCPGEVREGDAVEGEIERIWRASEARKSVGSRRRSK